MFFNTAPCDPEELQERLKELYSDFKDDIQRVVNDLSWKTFGNFLSTVTLLLSKLAAGATTNLLTFATATLLGNIVGGVAALIGLTIAMFNGVNIVLMWLAATRHSAALQARIALTNALLREINYVILILQSLKALSEDNNLHLLEGVSLALNRVKSARRLVGIEQSKINNSYKLGRIGEDVEFVSDRNLKRAQGDVTFAISHLTGDTVLSPALSSHIEKLNNKYQIGGSYTIGNEVVSVSVPFGTAGLLEYFSNATKVLIYQDNPDFIRAFVIDFINSPGISKFVRTYAASRFLNSHLDSLGIRFPISSVALKRGITEVIRNTPIVKLSAKEERYFKKPLDDIFDYLTLRNSPVEIAYPNATANLGTTTMFVKISQAAILMLESWLKIVQYEAGPLRAFLTPAQQKLRNIQEEMETVLENPGEVTKFQIGVDKIGWIAELGFVRNLLASSTESPLNFKNNTKMSAGEINERFRFALNLFKGLQTFILNRTVDEDGNAIPQEGDEALNIANAQLNSFILGKVSLFSVANRAHILSNLQAIRILLQKQQGKDLQEQQQTNIFIAEVNRNPLFRNVLKPTWDGMMDELGPLARDIVGDIDKGDLSTFVNILTTSAYAQSRLRKIINCGDEEKAEKEITSVLLSGSDNPDTEDILEDVHSSINSLKNFQVKFDYLTKTLTQ